MSTTAENLPASQVLLVSSLSLSRPHKKLIDTTTTVRNSNSNKSASNTNRNSICNRNRDSNRNSNSNSMLWDIRIKDLSFLRRFEDASRQLELRVGDLGL